MGEYKRTYLKKSNNKEIVPKKFGFFETILNFLWVIFKLFLLYLVLRLLLIGVIRTTNIATENRVNLNSIPAPTQVQMAGSATKAIKDGNAQITYVAEYKINGRVVDIEKYAGSNIKNQLSSRDIGLAWGILSTDETQKKITWSSLGNRLLNWKISDDEWYQNIGGKSAIITNHSNNHLIPANDEIERKIKTIRKGDFVQFEGYLADVYYQNSKDTYFKWNTSISRADDGEGAGEIIFVTDIKWLR